MGGKLSRKGAAALLAGTIAWLGLASAAAADAVDLFFTGVDGFGVDEQEALLAAGSFEIPIIEPTFVGESTGILSVIEQDFKDASAIYDRTPNVYARRFSTQTMGPLYRRFFRVGEGEAGFLTVEDFLKELAEANDRYLDDGGEEGYE